MTTDRDFKMGRALEALPLPELSSGYYERLRELLEQERRAQRSSRRRPRVLRIAIAAAAVVAAAAAVAFAVLPALRGGPETATAAEMLASMNAAAGSAQVVRMTIVEQRLLQSSGASPSASASETGRTRPITVDEQLTLSTSGDLRYTGERELVDGAGNLVRTRTLETYDARIHTMMRDGETHLVEGRSVPDLNPYGRPQMSSVIVERPAWGTTVFSTFLLANFQALSNSLRALLAEADPATPVELVSYLDRPAWRTSLREVLPSAAGAGVPVEWTVTVDKETGLLVASVLRPGAGEELPRGLARAFRVTRLEVDPRLPDAWQRIDTAGMDDIAIFDSGTRFGTPTTVAARAWPTLVLVPQDVPEGYRLTDVATRDYEGMKKARGDTSRLVTLHGRDPRKYAYVRAHIDASTQRVQLRYRRGFSSFVITLRPLGKGGDSGSEEAGAGRSGAEEVVLTGGYLKGAKASLWISPYFGEGPTLVTSSDRSRVTITGDLTREELLAVADSLTAVGDVDRPLPERNGE